MVVSRHEALTRHVTGQTDLKTVPGERARHEGTGAGAPYLCPGEMELGGRVREPDMKGQVPGLCIYVQERWSRGGG